MNKAVKLHQSVELLLFRGHLTGGCRRPLIIVRLPSVYDSIQLKLSVAESE